MYFFFWSGGANADIARLQKSHHGVARGIIKPQSRRAAAAPQKSGIAAHINHKSIGGIYRITPGNSLAVIQTDASSQNSQFNS